MNKPELLLLYRYNTWSSAKILDAASHITQEQFLAPASFPHGSLRETLIHAFFAEWLWRNRWQGTAPHFTFRWKPEEFPTVESLRSRWADEEDRLIKFVESLPDEGLYSKIKYISTEGNPHERLLWESLLHLITHGMQHKTEAAAMLTSFGHSPGDLDLIVYLNQLR